MTPTTDRRSFLKAGGLTATSLILGLNASASDLFNLSNPTNAVVSLEVSPLIILENTGKIILMAHKPEIGQGTYQSMPLLVAEELEVSLEQVEIRQASADKKYGNMGVGGSYSVRGEWNNLRKAGAAAREMLTTAAAQTWNVPVAECIAREGKITHQPTNRSLPYGDLTEKARTLTVPTAPKLKDAKDFRLIGKASKRPDIPAKVTGQAKFGIDAEVPGMLYASVERPPVFGATVIAVDDTATKNLAGVRHVLRAERKLNRNTYPGVAVLADTYWAALQGRRMLTVTWDNGPNANVDSAQLSAQFKQLAQTDGYIATNIGNFDDVFDEAPKKLEAEYELPFAAHAPMEPQNCLAWAKGDTAEIWTSTQLPNDVQKETAKLLGIKPESVTVHVMFVGGGFGRRLFIDQVLEAVALSKQVGKPVKVVWTREDDMTAGPFRPATYSLLRAGFDADGKPVAFQHKVVAPSISDSQFGKPDAIKRHDGGAMEGLKEAPYEFPNLQYNNIFADVPMPLGWWRAVYSATTCFAHESFIDEMAHAVGQDPLAFRLSLIQKNTRMKNLLTFLREQSGWDKSLPTGWGKGVAFWQFFAGQAGHVVFVSKSAKGVKIERIVAAIDCGTAVNPDNVRAQIEGATVMALRESLKPALTFGEGRASQTNYHDYAMLRINETPPIEVHILPSTDAPSGVGEPGLPPAAPALANAIFAATGQRVRRLPFSLES
jgi:isoquinoline 1-oxidoreductase subunit beta